MTKILARPWGWVTTLPLLCAVHCALTPLVVLAVPTLAPVKAVEAWLLAGTALVAGAALTVGMRRHRSPAVVGAVSVGLVVWAFSLRHAFQPVPEEITTVGASLLVAGGLLWNSRLLCGSREPSCECPACDQPAESAAPPEEPRSPVRWEERVANGGLEKGGVRTQDVAGPGQPGGEA